MITTWAHVPVGHNFKLKWQACFVLRTTDTFLMEFFLRTVCALTRPGKVKQILSLVLEEHSCKCHLYNLELKEYKSLMICRVRNVENLERVFGKASYVDAVVMITI